jgi:hyperosmotically inducible protein
MRLAFLRPAVVLACAIVMAGCAETDAGITTAVKSKLVADDQVKAYQIDVDTSNKVVTLSGEVGNAAAKTRAVEIARATDGVANVVDNIRVTATPPATPPTPNVDTSVVTDPAITTAVKAKFVVDDMVRALQIDVDTREGVVTLTGKVKSQVEKDRALTLARETNGVKSVVDRLTIAP